MINSADYVNNSFKASENSYSVPSTRVPGNAKQVWTAPGETEEITINFWGISPPGNYDAHIAKLSGVILKFNC